MHLAFLQEGLKGNGEDPVDTMYSFVSVSQR
jgi:hypothetical protein